MRTTWIAAAFAAGLFATAVVAPGCKGNINDDSVQVSATVRSSVAGAATQGNADVSIEHVSMSADGRFVAFASSASNLVANDTNGKLDIFIRDMEAGTTICVSMKADGSATSNGESHRPSLSADGRYISWDTDGNDLLPALTAGDDPAADTVRDVYWKDLQTGDIRLISKASGVGGQKSNGHCRYALISADGRYVAFESAGDTLDGIGPGQAFDPVNNPDNQIPNLSLANDNPASGADIWRRDVLGPTPVTVLVSRASGLTGAKSNGISLQPTISDNGQFVGWESLGDNLVPSSADGGPDDNPGGKDVFRRDMISHVTIRCSVRDLTTNVGAIGDSFHAELSGNGQFLAFRTVAPLLTPNDPGTEPDVMVRDIANNRTIICSVHSSGAQAGSTCHHLHITQDGRFVVFESASTNLVNGDGNNQTDAFMHDVVTGSTVRVSVGTFGTEANGPSFRPRISRDGRFVAFVSAATNLADNDSNGTDDVYRRGPLR